MSRQLDKKPGVSRQIVKKASILSRQIDKKAVELALNDGRYAASPESKSNLKSPAWLKWHRIFDEHGKRLDYVVCTKCRVIHHHTPRTGTSGITNHKCSKLAELEGSKNAQEIFDKACCLFVASDLRPYNVISGIGFRHLIQTVIDLASRNHFNASNIIPSPKTIAQKTQQMAEEVRNKLVQHLHDNIENGCCAATVEKWTDDYRKLAYLTISIHYIDANWTQLHQRVLCTLHFPAEETGVDIVAETKNVLAHFGISYVDMDNVVFVTDSCSDNVDSYSYHRISCALHILNTVLSTTFDRQSLESVACVKPVMQFFDNCRELVAYFRQSSLMAQLDSALSQVVDARWNSHLAMLYSIKRNFDKIVQVLPDEETWRITCIDAQMLEALIQFLAPFEEISNVLESANKPTLHQVAPYHRHVLTCLAENTHDPTFIAELKGTAKRLLEEKFVIERFHRLGVFLNPKMRSMKPLNEPQRVQTFADARRLVESPLFRCDDSQIPRDESGDFSEEADNVFSGSGSPSKRRKLVSGISCWEDDFDGTSASAVSDEINTYRTMELSLDLEFDLLSWWKEHSWKFPALAKVAKYVLSIPASSVPSDRNFIGNGLSGGKLRSQLHPKNVDDLLFLRSNLDLM